jgi:alanyl-tRNA synthetase
MEIWNLVFIQFNAQTDGTFSPLKSKHVDTGIGLERVAGIVKTTENFSSFSQNPSNYGSDLFTYLFEKISALSKKIYRGTVAQSRETLSEQEKIDFAFRVIADHVRALTFAIADKILPGNEGRHYVLRRILRRAVMFAKRLALPRSSLTSLADAVVDYMAPPFPELGQQREMILKTIAAEEAMFEKTLDRGMALLEEVCSRSKHNKIDGRDAFTLYDTYGFPLDLTQLIARERGFSVEEEGFQRELEKQRERARQAQKKSQVVVALRGQAAATEFVGYEQMENVDAKILQIFQDGDALYLITDRTPFYAEMGGEVGDTGSCIRRGESIKILNTIQDARGNILHKVWPGVQLAVGDAIILNVDTERRLEIQRHHSATHLMHTALREVLGLHVKQSGSRVDACGLHFDFNHFSALSQEELGAVEAFVNRAILQNLPVTKTEMPFAQVPGHCIAHFSEKYGERVRVVAIGEVSMELCGGCHVNASGELGFFKIVREGAIAAGMRRMEAVVGQAAWKYIGQHFAIVNALEREFSVKNDEILVKIEQLQSVKSATEHRLRAVLQKNNQKIFEEICRNSTSKQGLKKVTGIFEIENANDLRFWTNLAANQEKCDIVIFAGNLAKNATVAVGCSRDAIDKNHSASTVAKRIAEKLQGKGGGSPVFGMVNVERRIGAQELDALNFL